MSDYLNSRSDEALELLIARSVGMKKLTEVQQETVEVAKRILAERSAQKVATHFDIHRAIAFLETVASEGSLCSYKDLALACINNPDAQWSTYYRKIGGSDGLMQSIIRHCAARELPQLSSLVVRQQEVEKGPDVAPNRDGEAEFGFKRGLVDEGLSSRNDNTDKLVLDHRQACFSHYQT